MAILDRKYLLTTHDLYARHKEEWDLYLAAFEGTRALLRVGALQRHSRESAENYERRREQAISFNYSRSVVEIFLHYLFERAGQRQLGALANDAQLRSFLGDVDFAGTDYDRFWFETQQYASVLGHAGVLVAKPAAEALTVEEERAAGVWPCFSRYLPQAILDWRFRRNAAGRPGLALLKVIDDDGTVRVWTPEAWETWEPDGRGSYPDQPTEEGANPLGVVPFVWHVNQRGRDPRIGVSDIQDVARIDVSIMRNLSQADEVVDLAAFPMLMMPRQPRGEVEADQAVGPSAVLEFDPHLPDSRPGWLRAEVLEPLEAILSLVQTKVREIYRMTNTQAEALRSDQQLPSGRALELLFRQLNARLGTKADALEESELACLRHWAAWQGRSGDVGGVRVQRPRDFNVRDLATDLADLVSAGQLVRSRTFSRELQKAAVGLVLPQLDDGARSRIQEEIQAGA